MNDVVRILLALKAQERAFRFSLLDRAKSEGLTEQDVLRRDRGPPEEAPAHVHRMWARMKGMERAVGIVNYILTENPTTQELACDMGIRCRLSGARRRCGAQVQCP